MKVIKAWEEEGVQIKGPYQRTIRTLLAPDKNDVKDLTFAIAYIDPGSRTDTHTHDRPELMYIVSGRGISLCNGVEVSVEPDMVLLNETGEVHAMINTGCETLKMVTIFVPAITAEQNFRRALEAK